MARRVPAARHLHQVHPVSRHGRLHGRHRRHHLRQPDAGAARPRHRERASRAAAEARGDLGKHSAQSSRPPSRFPPLAIAIIVGLRRVPPEVARTADRRCVRRLLACRAPPRCRDHRLAVRRRPAHAAGPALPAFDLAKMRARAARCRRHRSARRHREPVVGGGRRRHERAAGIAPTASWWRRAPPTSRQSPSAACASPAPSPARRRISGGRARTRSPACCMPSTFLLFMLVAAPLAAYIPLASLGAVLAVVAWNMAEKEEFASLMRASGATRPSLWRPSCSPSSPTSRSPSASA